MSNLGSYIQHLTSISMQTLTGELVTALNHLCFPIATKGVSGHLSRQNQSVFLHFALSMLLSGKLLFFLRLFPYSIPTRGVSGHLSSQIQCLRFIIGKPVTAFLRLFPYSVPTRGVLGYLSNQTQSVFLQLPLSTFYHRETCNWLPSSVSLFSTYEGSIWTSLKPKSIRLSAVTSVYVLLPGNL